VTVAHCRKRTPSLKSFSISFPTQYARRRWKPGTPVQTKRHQRLRHMASDRRGTDRNRWSPSMVKLVGIEHTWNKEVEVFRGTRIGYLVGLVMRRYPEHHSQLTLAVAE